MTLDLSSLITAYRVENTKLIEPEFETKLGFKNNKGA
jgi:hypothetical protein